MNRLYCPVVGLLFTAFTGHVAAQTTTIITHGFGTSGGIPAWQRSMGVAIAQRRADSSVHRYDPATGSWISEGAWGGDPTRNIVLLMDWTDEDDALNIPPNWEYAQAAASAFYAAIREPSGSLGGQDLLHGRTLHLIGHSRGTSVNSELTLHLLRGGLRSIDQVTMLDAHPVCGIFREPEIGFPQNWGDPIPRVWDGIAWSDYFYRADGGWPQHDYDFDGLDHSMIPGTKPRRFEDALFEGAGYEESQAPPESGEHGDVHLWYHGTVHPTATSDGEKCITDAMRQTWWQARGFGEGYAYSAVGGQSRPADGGPLSGRVPLEGRAVIPNGGFDQDSLAGWFYHGGDGTAQPENGRLVFRRTQAEWRRSNRFWLEESASRMRFDLTAGAASQGDALSVSLFAAGVSHTQLAPLTPAGTRPVSIDVPCRLRGRTVQIEFRLLTNGGSDHSVDNVEMITDAGEWSLVSANSTGRRNVGAACWDIPRRSMIVFGGNDGSGALGDTWEWNGSVWIRRSPGGGPNEPSRRWGTSMAFDASRSVAVLFGGYQPGDIGDTWEWNGIAWNRRSLGGGANEPARRSYAAVTYDARRQRVVLFGGNSGSNVFGDTWEWDGTRWERRATGGPARTYAAMAYDGARDRIVLFGGSDHDGSPTYNDTWEWNGDAGIWTPVNAVGPSGRGFHAMVYDPIRSRVLVFGGGVYSTTQAFQDVWEFDGVSWRRLLETSPFGARAGPQSCYDLEGRRMLVCGGVVPQSAPAQDAWGLSSARTASCCRADFNGDGFLDFLDFSDYVGCFDSGMCPPGFSADFNLDGFVDFLDYDEFVAAFERGC